MRIILLIGKLIRLNEIEKQGIAVFVLNVDVESASWPRSNQLESYFSKQLNQHTDTVNGYRVIYGNVKQSPKAISVIEERGDIKDLVINHSEKTDENKLLVTFVQIEEGCFLVFYKEFDSLKEYATTYYNNFVVFQKTFPETLGYLRVNVMEVDNFPN